MTFASAAWAIDGAFLTSSLARRAVFDSSGGFQGVTNRGSLRVDPLEVPGVGVRIAGGSGLVLNRYQTIPNESYAVSNPGVHTVTADEMPPPSNNARSFIVAVTVGDPEWSQNGHPWMRSDDPAPGTEATFQYVRPFLIQVPPGTRRLSVGYPALELARLDIPANTSTISAGMITDLREIVMPKSVTRISHVTSPTDNPLNGDGGDYTKWERWPNIAVLSTLIPEWATVAKVSGFIEGIKLFKDGRGTLRARIAGNGNEGLATSYTNWDEQPLLGVDGVTWLKRPDGSLGRVSYNVGGEINIPASLRGTNVTFIVEGKPMFENSKGALRAINGQTSVMLQVVFEEVPT